MVGLVICSFMLMLASGFAGASIHKGVEDCRKYKNEPDGYIKDMYKGFIKGDFLIAASLLLSGVTLMLMVIALISDKYFR